jgi:hypothetical protein
MVSTALVALSSVVTGILSSGLEQAVRLIKTSVSSKVAGLSWLPGCSLAVLFMAGSVPFPCFCYVHYEQCLQKKRSLLVAD